MTAVITFGRSAAGVRTVMIPMTGALTSGVKNANAPTTTIAAAHGIEMPSRKSGSGIATIETVASLSRSVLRASCCATSAPASAPTPKPPNRNPTTRAFAP